jgi:hypothetical protein
MANIRWRNSSRISLVHLPRLVRILDAGGEPFREPELLVDRLEEHRPSIGAAVFLIEPHHDGLREEILEQNSLCGRIRQRRASGLRRNGGGTPFLPHQGLFST